jgi:tetratricopeptide (TPR) repeat protein
VNVWDVHFKLEVMGQAELCSRDAEKDGLLKSLIDRGGMRMRTHLFFFIALSFLLLIPDHSQAGEEKNSRGPVGVPTCRRSLLLAEIGQETAEAALADCEAAVQKQRRDASAYRYRSIAYRQAGRLDEAAKDIESALDWVSKYSYAPEDYVQRFKSWAPIAYDQLAWKHMGNGNWGGAIADWTRAIEIRPSFSEGFFYRGLAQARAGNCADAVADLNRFMASRQTSAAGADRYEKLYAQARQGECYRKLGQDERAQGIAAQMVETEPRLAAKFLGGAALDLFDRESREKKMREASAAARAAEADGNVLEAFRQWDEVRKWPEVLTVTPLLSRFYPAPAAQLLKESSEALVRLYPKLSVKPALSEEARRFAVPAKSAQEERRYGDAVAFYEQALTAAPWWPEGHFNLALMREQSQSFSEAIAHMRTYLSLSPDAPDARKAQDRIYDWQARVGGVFDTGTLIGAWSGPLAIYEFTYVTPYEYTYRGRIAPDPGGGLQLMVLDKEYGKRLEPVGYSYHLDFSGRKFKAGPYDDATVTSGELAPSGNSIELEYKLVQCHGFVPKCDQSVMKKVTWSRGGSEVGGSGRDEQKAGKIKGEKK